MSEKPSRRRRVKQLQKKRSRELTSSTFLDPSLFEDKSQDDAPPPNPEPETQAGEDSVTVESEPTKGGPLMNGDTNTPDAVAEESMDTPPATIDETDDAPRTEPVSSPPETTEESEADTTSSPREPEVEPEAAPEASEPNEVVPPKLGTVHPKNKPSTEITADELDELAEHLDIEDDKDVDHMAEDALAATRKLSPRKGTPSIDSDDLEAAFAAEDTDVDYSGAATIKRLKPSQSQQRMGGGGKAGQFAGSIPPSWVTPTPDVLQHIRQASESMQKIRQSNRQLGVENDLTEEEQDALYEKMMASMSGGSMHALNVHANRNGATKSSVQKDRIPAKPKVPQPMLAKPIIHYPRPRLDLACGEAVSGLRPTVEGVVDTFELIAMTKLPKGLRLHRTTGEIIGTPVREETKQVMIRVRNKSASETVVLTIAVVDKPTWNEDEELMEWENDSGVTSEKTSPREHTEHSPPSDEGKLLWTEMLGHPDDKQSKQSVADNDRRSPSPSADELLNEQVREVVEEKVQAKEAKLQELMGFMQDIQQVVAQRGAKAKPEQSYIRVPDLNRTVVGIASKALLVVALVMFADLMMSTQLNRLRVSVYIACSVGLAALLGLLSLFHDGGQRSSRKSKRE